MYKLASNLLQSLQSLGLPELCLVFSFKLPGGSLNGHSLRLQKELNLLEKLYVLGSEEPVALGIASGFDFLREGIGPETDAGRTFLEQVRDFADGVKQLFHISQGIGLC